MTTTLERVIALGFDLSTQTHNDPHVHIRCSQCEALVVNNVPTHESGCPNAVHECRGCNALISMRRTYCPECLR